MLALLLSKVILSFDRRASHTINSWVLRALFHSWLVLSWHAVLVLNKWVYKTIVVNWAFDGLGDRHRRHRRIIILKWCHRHLIIMTLHKVLLKCLCDYFRDHLMLCLIIVRLTDKFILEDVEDGFFIAELPLVLFTFHVVLLDWCKGVFIHRFTFIGA